MIIKCDKETVFTFSVIPPLYLPFYNSWASNAYYTYNKFDYEPSTIRSSSTSGSPVILAGNSFFGFMSLNGGRFIYDGWRNLTVICPAGQSFYYSENCNPYEEWQNYNAEIMKEYPSRKTEEFWSGLEYCTWVDQSKTAALEGIAPQNALNEKFVYEYMDRIERLGLPKGKLTIDYGWDKAYDADGNRIWGNWEIDRDKFPHMEQLVKDMKARGFYPGLWFAPFTVKPQSEIGKEHPELLGGPFEQDAESEMFKELIFLRPDACLEKYYREIFSYYISMGFMKFKLDMSYGSKSDMIKLLEMIYKVIKETDETVEVEAHIPDIFATRHCDTLRINDVKFDEEGKWRAVTQEHHKVCRYSSPDKILNLDHLGTNTPVPKEADFLEHSKMLLTLDGGYPCVSLLPDLFGESVSEIFADEIHKWVKAQGK